MWIHAIDFDTFRQRASYFIIFNYIFAIIRGAPGLLSFNFKRELIRHEGESSNSPKTSGTWLFPQAADCDKGSVLTQRRIQGCTGAFSSSNYSSIAFLSGIHRSFDVDFARLRLARIRIWLSVISPSTC